MATIVTNKSELEKALKAKKFPIKIKGEYAIQLSKKYHTKKKVKKTAMIGGAVTAIASAAAIPFTGGGSAAGVAAGVSAMGLTLSIGTATVAMTAGELAILCGFALGAGAIAGGLLSSRKLTVKFGKTEVEINEKV